MCRPLRRRAATGPGGTAWPLGHEAGPASMISACRCPPRLAGRRRTTRRCRDSPSLAAPRIHSPQPRPVVTRSGQPQSPLPESLATARRTEAQPHSPQPEALADPPSLDAPRRQSRRPAVTRRGRGPPSLAAASLTRRGPSHSLRPASLRLTQSFTGSPSLAAPRRHSPRPAVHHSPRPATLAAA